MDEAKRALAEEGRRGRFQTPEEQVDALIRVCRAGMRLLALRDDRDQILAHVDPLPQCSLRALARLRQEHRQRQRHSSEADTDPSRNK